MATGRSPVRAVLFDVGGTLVRVQGGVGAVYSAAARRHGVDVAPEELERRFRDAWKRSLARRRAQDYLCSDDILRIEWRQIVGDCFAPAPERQVDDVFEDLYAEFATGSAWTVVPYAEDTLRLLRSRGVRLGILSNWDSRLEAMLVELGLDSYFDFRVVSYAAGVEKPHPAIFERALEMGGAPCDATLMVGDSWEADITPASNLGLQTLWIRSPTGSLREHEAVRQLREYPRDPEPFWAQWLTAI